MTPDDIRQALEITLVWKHPFRIHFTGGEPFLNFPLLLEAVVIARKLGIPCYCETNAGWCVNSDLVEKRIPS